MTANITPDARIPEPLATDAGTATRPVGPCSICRRGILRGQRYGLTYPAEDLAHVVCVALRASGTS